MFTNKTLLLLGIGAAFGCSNTYAEEIPVMGNVESKCVVTQDTSGVYGNPTPSVLSTDGTDGGVDPIVRYDVVQASFYKARISHPNDFSDSPTLDDIVNWTGSASTSQVSDAGMSAYDTSKIEFDNVTEVELSIAGSTWFKVESQADYGYEKAFPAGVYQAIMSAECIAI
jgi:hypothetical protein